MAHGTRLRLAEQVQGSENYKTAWEFLKTTPYTGDVYQFGAPVQHRLSGPVQGGVVHESWHDGIYLGTQFSSGEHIVAMPDGKVVRARAIQPRPDGVPTTKAALDAIAPGPSGGSEVITQGSAALPPGKAEKAPGSSDYDPVPRGFRVTKDLLDKFEFSKGCPKCESLRRGENRTTVHHSKGCRKRIEELMKKDPALNKKVSEVEDRQNRWLGRRVEAHDAPAPPTPSTEQAPEASAPESELEQLTVGSPMGPSGQGGEDQKIHELLENFQQSINMLEKNINELKEAQKEASKEVRQGQAELCSVQEG